MAKNNPVWEALVDDEMVKHLSQDEVIQLMEDLSDAVMAICQEYGVE